MFTVGRLVGSCSPATDNDGHATKRPSTFFEHRRRLIQPTRKPTDLTNPSTDTVPSRLYIDGSVGGDVVHPHGKAGLESGFTRRRPRVGHDVCALLNTS